MALVDEAVLMDVTGSLRLFGGLAKLVEQLERQLRQFFESNRALAQVGYVQAAMKLEAKPAPKFSARTA